MRCFIDTNIFLFIKNDPDELNDEVKAILEDYENSFIISSESIREIAALIKSGRIEVKGWQTYYDIKHSLDSYGIEIRYVNESHLKTLFKLTPAPNHSDPTDLMIIAQAITEDLPLVSSDTKFPLYVAQGLNFVYNRRGAKARRIKNRG